ncbi:ABC transporter ATP-binding protein/permease [Paenibacillus sp. sptzw28]|uniref:ABC transporter ATP-binding protein n=1 Tax=Paenibacillus sp. sptzw28 TaxID=715179 RepID=UPI001C6EDA60|nr:ABC transporter ATP-binding protein [Paenibacillus sp. sptzw28]QYR23711.1 ABC transporter ATP-binding protein/permease [Paenibacillus sp. sptzw28]
MEKRKQKADSNGRDSSPPSGNSSWASYRWVLSFLKPYKGKISLLFLTGAVAVAGETAAPKMIQFIIDEIMPNRNMHLFMLMLIVLLGMNIIMMAAKMARNLLQRILGESASRDVQHAIFTHLRRLGFAYYERHPAGESLSMMNTELLSVMQIYRMYLPGVIDNLLFVSVSVAFMIGISPQLTLVMIPCFALYYLFGPYFERKASRYGKQNAQRRMVYQQRVYESISGLREFRAFGSQDWDMERTIGSHREWSKIYLLAGTFGFARGSFRRITFYAGAIGTFVLGYYILQWGLISIGGFVAFTLLYLNAMFRLTVLVTQLTEQRMLVYQIQPIYNFIREPILIDEPADPVTLPSVNGSLSFRNVHFGYPDLPPVIRGFTLDIQAGERVAFIGTSGGGKSTMFKLIGRFYDPTDGEIRLDGVPIRNLSLSQLRESVGYVFQETYLFGASVKENIRFGKPDATDEEIIEAAKAAYAHDFIVQLPGGYDTLVGERGLKLSGGQKQRVAIARMFIKQPAIVLLDEATSSLDNVSEGEVQKALDTTLLGRTTIAIAHRLSTVKHFDRIVVIHEGQVAETGSYDELFSRKGLLYDLVMGETAGREKEVLNEIY